MFSSGTISFDSFAPCKRIYILQLYLYCVDSYDLLTIVQHVAVRLPLKTFNVFLFISFNGWFSNRVSELDISSSNAD